MKRSLLILLMILMPMTMLAQSGVGGGGQSNVSGGSGGSSTGTVGYGAAPGMRFYFSPNCPPANVGNCFYTPANTQQAIDANWTTGSTTVTTVGNHFCNGGTYPCTLYNGQVTDVGKQIGGYTNCNAFNSLMSSTANSGAMTTNASNISTVYTITAVNAANSITVSANPQNANGVANAGCIYWGNPDDSYAVTLDAALALSPTCPRVSLISANYLFAEPHFFTNPNACLHLPMQNPGGQGNIFYSGGFSLEGVDNGATIFWLTPGFPENNLACPNGPSSNACWVVPLEGHWSDFTITGGLNSQANGHYLAANEYVVYQVGPSTIERVNLLNFGAGENFSHVIGLGLTYWSQLRQVDNSGMGYICAQAIGNVNISMTWFRCENSTSVGLDIASGVTGQILMQDSAIYLPQVANTQGGSTIPPIGIRNGGTETLQLVRTNVFPAVVITGQIGYKGTVSGNNVYLENNSSLQSASQANNIGVDCTAACSVYLVGNSFLTGGSTGKAYVDVTGSILYDQVGGNYATNFPTSLNGAVSGSASAAGVASATGNWALTSGWGTSSVASAAGDSHRTLVTITGAAGSASPVLTWTFPKAYPFAAPSACSLLEVGANDITGGLTSVSPGTPTTTGVAFTFVGTPTAVTYVFDASCGP